MQRPSGKNEKETKNDGKMESKCDYATFMCMFIHVW